MKPQHRLLIVDDNASVRDWFEAFATRLGYAVTCVDSGEEALELVRRKEPDLITLDLSCPAWTVSRRCAERATLAPQVPVIMLSGHGQTRTIVEAMRLGATDFLRKPFEVEELEVALRRRRSRTARSRKQGERLPRAFSAALRVRSAALRRRQPEHARGRRDHRAGRRHRHHRAVRGESGTGKELVARALFAARQSRAAVRS